MSLAVTCCKTDRSHSPLHL